MTEKLEKSLVLEKSEELQPQELHEDVHVQPKLPMLKEKRRGPQGDKT